MSEAEGQDDKAVASAESGPAETGPEGEMITAAEFHETFHNVRKELAKVVIGQDRVVEHLLVAVFAGGHILLSGMPGLAPRISLLGSWPPTSVHSVYARSRPCVPQAASGDAHCPHVPPA